MQIFVLKKLEEVSTNFATNMHLSMRKYMFRCEVEGQQIVRRGPAEECRRKPRRGPARGPARPAEVGPVPRELTSPRRGA